MNKHQIYIACDRNNLKSIRDFLWDIFRQYPVSETDSYEVILAVDEVCANMIIHANACDPTKFLEVNVYFSHLTEVTFEIKDQGHLFEFEKYQVPEMDDIIKTRKKGGLGMILVKKIMDHVEFIQRGEINVCLLKKKLSPKNHV